MLIPNSILTRLESNTRASCLRAFWANGDFLASLGSEPIVVAQRVALDARADKHSVFLPREESAVVRVGVIVWRRGLVPSAIYSVSQLSNSLCTQVTLLCLLPWGKGGCRAKEGGGIVPAGAVELPIGLRGDTRSGDVALIEVWVRVALLAGAAARRGRWRLGEGERGEEKEDDADDADDGLHCSE